MTRLDPVALIPVDLLAAARALEDETQFEAAISKYEDAANAFVELGQEEQALKCIRDGLAIRDYLRAIGSDHDKICKYAHSKIEADQLGAATAACSNALKFPSQAGGYVIAGLIAERKGEKAEFEALIRRAIQISPSIHGYYFILSRALIANRSYKSAAEALSQSMKLMAADGSTLSEKQQKAIANGVPPICLISQHKSASEYLRDALVHYLDAELIYPTLGTIPVDYPVDYGFFVLSKGGAVARLHSDANEQILAAIHQYGIDKQLIVVRDPRQSLLSWVHHLGSLPKRQFMFHRQYFEPIIPLDYQELTLACQLDWAIGNIFCHLQSWLEGWVAYEGKFAVNGKVKLVKFEDMLRDPSAYFDSIAGFFAVDFPGYDQISADFPASAHGNFRQGSTDEWREVLTSKQRDAMTKGVSDSVVERLGLER